MEFPEGSPKFNNDMTQKRKLVKNLAVYILLQQLRISQVYHEYPG